MTKRILRLTATPHAVAAGVAAGAFTSFTPFMGFHFILAFAFAWIIRGNFIASALGTFVGNPITFPLIWAATYQTGHFILGSTASTEGTPAVTTAMGLVLDALWNLNGAEGLAALKSIWLPILYPMTVGGAIIGLVVSIPIYFLTRRTALLFRESRRKKLMAKAMEIKEISKRRAEEKQMSQGLKSQ